MASAPLITFKAGKCVYSETKKVKPLPEAGYVYLYSEDEFIHFCWRPRSAPSTSPELDLLMIPGDASFVPYIGSDGNPSSEDLRSPTDGRIFVLKFSSSSQRHFFWLQSKSQHPEGHDNWFSKRDQKLGQIVDMFLSGEDVDVNDELQEVQEQPRGGDGDAMDDVQGTGHDQPPPGPGGAGSGATGGDFEEEGEESREGGADGARARTTRAEANAMVNDFLRSLAPGRQQDKPFTTLQELLPASTTVAMVETASNEYLDQLCSLLPPTILIQAQESESDPTFTEPTPDAVHAAIQAMSVEQKRTVLKKVLRSPQLSQSLTTLSLALMDGGLPTIGGALQLDVEHGGMTTAGGNIPTEGGSAVEKFLEAIKRSVKKEEDEQK